MKPLSRIAALAVLLLPAWLEQPPARSGSADYPLRRPVTVDSLRQRGVLRLSISAESLQRSRAPFEPSDFDYDLLSRFASDLGIAVVVLEVPSDADAAQALRAGRADVAVLPAGLGGAGEVLRVRACPQAAAPPTAGPRNRLDAFARPDSPDLARLLDGATWQVADVEVDEGTYRFYCSRPLAASGAGLPFARGISRYKRLIAKHAEAAGLDWRLVAALISEESSFEEGAVSEAGARGLMQLMPGTHAEVGIASIASPEANIRAGVRYLGRLAEHFSEAPPADRLAFVLASYLLGPGHVFDAQGLARQLGLNPHGWQRGLEETLPLLEDERFFSDTRLGFARGRRAVEYVNRILGRYELYRSRLARHSAAQADLDA